jgi:exonuclease VII large subunit
MSDFARILEEELEEAVEVKNRKSLHRYITLLTGNMTRKEENRMEHIEFQKELIKIDGRFNQHIIEIREGFKRMDQRFEALQASMNQRFEALQTNLDQRFETFQTNLDQRFETFQTNLDQRFETFQTNMDQRFGAVQQQMDHRFESVNKRFEAMDARFNRQTALMSIGIIVITTLISVYQFLG